MTSVLNVIYARIVSKKNYSWLEEEHTTGTKKSFLWAQQ